MKYYIKHTPNRFPMKNNQKAAPGSLGSPRSPGRPRHITAVTFVASIVWMLLSSFLATASLCYSTLQ